MHVQLDRVASQQSKSSDTLSTEIPSYLQLLIALNLTLFAYHIAHVAPGISPL